MVSPTTPSFTLQPYLQSFSNAAPYSYSERSAYLWIGTSKRAVSQLVLVWVGRRTKPNWMSEFDSGVRTVSGKATRSIFRASSQ